MSALPPKADIARLWVHAIDRHRHRLEGAVAVDQIDPLLHDAEARTVTTQLVGLTAGEHALRIVAVFDHDHRRADDEFAVCAIGRFDDDVAHEMRGARGRRLHVDARSEGHTSELQSLRY